MKTKYKMTKKDFKIVESIHGNFFYHLSEDGKNPICDSKIMVMQTRLPLSSWGIKTHLHEKYCKKCEKEI